MSDDTFHKWDNLSPKCQIEFHLKNLDTRPVFRDGMISKIIQCGIMGYTKRMLALELGISRSTLYRWMEGKHLNENQFKIFKEAIHKFEDLTRTYFDKIAMRACSQNPNLYNATMIEMERRRRFRDSSDDLSFTSRELEMSKDTNERIETLHKLLATGEISPSQYQKSMQGIKLAIESKNSDIEKLFIELKEEFNKIKEDQLNGSTQHGGKS